MVQIVLNKCLVYLVGSGVCIEHEYPVDIDNPARMVEFAKTCGDVYRRINDNSAIALEHPVAVYWAGQVAAFVIHNGVGCQKS